MSTKILHGYVVKSHDEVESKVENTRKLVTRVALGHCFFNEWKKPDENTATGATIDKVWPTTQDCSRLTAMAPAHWLLA